MRPTENVAVLLVDDDDFFRMAVRELLAVRRASITVFEAANGEDALALLEHQKIHCVVTDLAMPRMDGIALVEAMINRGLMRPMVIVSAYAQDVPSIEGLPRCVPKPVDLYALGDRILQQLDHPATVTAMGLIHVLACDRRSCSVLLESAAESSKRAPTGTDPWSGGLVMVQGQITHAWMMELGSPTRVGDDAAIEAFSRSAQQVRVEPSRPTDAATRVDQPLLALFASARVRRNARRAGATL